MYCSRRSNSPTWSNTPTVALDLFPASWDYTDMQSKNNPDTPGYFHVNFIPCLVALLITHTWQSAHCEYWHLWTILMIHVSIEVLCHVVDLKHGLVTSWENVLFTLENMGTCVKLTWNYFPCLVLHKVKVFIDYVQGLVQLLLLLIFASMISFLHCLSSWKTAKLLITMVAK